MEIKVK